MRKKKNLSADLEKKNASDNDLDLTIKYGNTIIIADDLLRWIGLGLAHKSIIGGLQVETCYYELSTIKKQ